MPVVFRIDVEPDHPFMDHSCRLPWRGFERGFDTMRSLRDRIERATGSPARFDWQLRMDPQIAEAYGTPSWAAERYAPLLESIVAQGDEVGLHVHALRWLPGEQKWCEDFGDQEWVEQCVRTACAAYRQAFGRPCAVLSMGNRWLNDATVRLLEALGIEIDLTVEPGHPLQPRARGIVFADGLSRRRCPLTDDLPALSNVPRQPYRPSKTDFRVADPIRRDGIWLMPSTSGVVPRSRLRRFYDRLRGIDPKTKGHVTLMPVIKPRWFRLIVEDALRRPETTLLAMLMRTHMFARPALCRNIAANIESLLERQGSEPLEFTTSKAVMMRLVEFSR